MLLSRFWYVLLSLLIGALLFTLYIAQSMFNRAGTKVIGEGLSSDSQVVSWYMRSASRERSSHLITFALNPDVAQALSQASGKPESVPKAAREKANAAISKLARKLPEDSAFDAVFAVDQHGRVVGQFGYEQTSNNPDFQLGGYPVVADALHGSIRDDMFVWERMYAVVARPVEYSAGDLPVGAIVGLKLIDDQFARDISARTGAAVAFYVNGERTASGAPEGFDRSQLDGIVTDVKLINEDQDYVEKGRSKVRYLSPTVGVVYSRLNGEAWARGAGYVVGRAALVISTPFSFFGAADDKDKASASFVVIGGISLLAMVLGILFSVLEHTRPLNRFKAALMELAEGKVDHLQASRVSGVYRQIVTAINDGIDRAASKGGGTRRVADLGQVLGDMPQQPAMSAFAFPDSQPSTSSAGLPRIAVPSPASAPQSAPLGAVAGSLPKPPPRPGAGTVPSAGVAVANPPAVVDEAAEWRAVYEDFLATKQRCGEPTEGLSYEKFEGTLRKTRQGIVEKHNVARVKFSVYVKDGKAALKANPVRD